MLFSQSPSPGTSPDTPHILGMFVMSMFAHVVFVHVQTCPLLISIAGLRYLEAFFGGLILIMSVMFGWMVSERERERKYILVQTSLDLI